MHYKLSVSNLYFYLVYFLCKAFCCCYFILYVFPSLEILFHKSFIDRWSEQYAFISTQTTRLFVLILFLSLFLSLSLSIHSLSLSLLIFIDRCSEQYAFISTQITLLFILIFFLSLSHPLTLSFSTSLSLSLSS